jgi:hypothetical protein
VEVVEKQHGENPLIHKLLFEAFKVHVNPKGYLTDILREYDGPAWYWTCEGQIELSNRNKTVYLIDIYQLAYVQ